jgi:signal-transduction protein with cAMP-binding, CBS, and nucleotidyltransferase domain
VAEDGWHQTVGAIMKKNVVSYEENTPAKDIFNFLCRVAIRRVVVVRQGIPVGMISRDTYLRWYANWLTTHKIESPEDEEFARYNSEDRIRDGINLVSIAIINNTKHLIKDLQQYHTVDEGIPSIVGGATRLQDLVNDLLSHCQHVHAC